MKWILFFKTGCFVKEVPSLRYHFYSILLWALSAEQSVELDRSQHSPHCSIGSRYLIQELTDSACFIYTSRLKESKVRWRTHKFFKNHLKCPKVFFRRKNIWTNQIRIRKLLFMMKYKALLFLNIVKLWRKNTLKVVKLICIL